MLFILKYILSISFSLAGGTKIFRAKPMVEQFKEFGLPNFTVVVVGLLELVGGIGLWFPKLSGFASIGLLLLMIGAIAYHWKVKHQFKMYIPALILGICTLVYVILTFK